MRRVMRRPREVGVALALLAVVALLGYAGSKTHLQRTVREGAAVIYSDAGRVVQRVRSGISSAMGGREAAAAAAAAREIERRAAQHERQASKLEAANKMLGDTIQQVKERQAAVQQLEADLAKAREQDAAARDRISRVEGELAEVQRAISELLNNRRVALANKAEQHKADVVNAAVLQEEKKADKPAEGGDAAAAADRAVDKAANTANSAAADKAAAIAKAVAEKRREKELGDASYQKFFFNEYLSSKLPLNRSIPDIRIDECKTHTYDTSKMPSTSIIICFVNESWSALLRTVWSVLNRSPAELVHEIILVDDHSDAEWLGQHLLDYMRDNFPEKVRYVRSPERLGLIRARLLGTKHATGEVLTFLDSHCECNVGWLEPILDVIARDHTTVVTPVIDSINDHTMAYTSYVSRVPAVGTFSWTLDFTWMTGQHKPTDRPEDPYDSPTMAGGLFSIHVDYFQHIGTYDNQMSGWGGENIEISFRIWMCGGRLVSAPCSHVGHIFRRNHPYTIPGSSIHTTFLTNSARLAEVWMDDYKEIYYSLRPEARKMQLGDLTERKALRKELKCKSFQWYLDNILPDMFIPDDKHIIKRGAIRNTDGHCVDTMGQKGSGVAGVYFCHGLGSNQAWMLSTNDEIRTAEDVCLDAWGSDFPINVHMAGCHGSRGNQAWKYDEETGVIKHVIDNACLESFDDDGGHKKLKVNRCNGQPSQRWTFGDVPKDSKPAEGKPAEAKPKPAGTQPPPRLLFKDVQDKARQARAAAAQAKAQQAQRAAADGKAS